MMKVGFKTSCLACIVAMGMWSTLSPPSSASLAGCFVTVTRNCDELTTPDSCSGQCSFILRECGTDYVKDPQKTYSGVAMPQYPDKGVDKRNETMAEVECGQNWECLCIPIYGETAPELFCTTMKYSNSDKYKVGKLKAKPYAADSSGEVCDGVLPDPLPDPNIARSAP